MSAPVLDALATLEGLISHEVGLKLYALARGVPGDQCIIEIGSYKGKSTAYLAAGAAAGNRPPVYAIDAWDLPGNAGGRFGFNNPDVMVAFETQLARAGVLGGVVPLKGFGAEIGRAWRRPRVGLLYIDGSHTEKDVRADYDAWSPHLASGAVVVFDDYDTPPNPGVKRVVDAIRRASSPAIGWEFEPRPLAIGYGQ